MLNRMFPEEEHPGDENYNVYKDDKVPPKYIQYKRMAWVRYRKR